MYIFGGRMDFGHEVYTGECFYSNDFYAFDTIKNIWTEIRSDTSRQILSAVESFCPKVFSPCGRRSHSAVVYKRKIIIFGGLFNF